MPTFKAKIDLKNLLDLQKFYKRAPRQFARASAGMINNLAFQARGEAIENIDDQMIIRNQRFINSRIKVQRARSGAISTQKATVGSVTADRFSGWIEQETGQAPEMTRSFSVVSRRGQRGNKVVVAARLRSASTFPTVDDYNIKAKDDDHRTMIFIKIMQRDQPRKPFVLKDKYKRFGIGIYKVLKRGRIKKLQSFDAPPTPKVRRWMEPAYKSVMTKQNIREQWARSIRHTLRLK